MSFRNTSNGAGREADSPMIDQGGLAPDIMHGNARDGLLSHLELVDPELSEDGDADLDSTDTDEEADRDDETADDDGW